MFPLDGLLFILALLLVVSYISHLKSRIWTRVILSRRTSLWLKMVKNLPCNAGDPGLIPGSGRSSGKKEMAIHSSILAWRIPLIEEPGGLQFMGLQRVEHD